ncbi:hypothetical protein SAMN04487950_0456 [Halogranum rubrum]|uniref:YdbS-like PH domain-containing protein n=1 Tax=Halogranum rubrum TaxID=553466 RepID=A0A1I4BE21_9EURY|nr:PH domain-containing protein [Halogranum rubrum]SFK66211.1 hypothetical protein SAMN04487950_0456 [Halogranum rubrum]
MRRENEWFKPEKLKQYYFAVEGILLVVVLAVVGVLGISGILFEVNQWVVVVGGSILLVVFGFVAWWIPAFFATADYRLTDDELEYRRGVFFRQKTTVPYNRITNVDAAQGPLQRLVDAGSVGVHTAGFGGQTGAELTISGVSDYEEIKDQILAKIRRRPPEATEGGDTDNRSRRESEERLMSGDVLTELRRIRELLEQGRVT